MEYWKSIPLFIIMIVIIICIIYYYKKSKATKTRHMEPFEQKDWLEELFDSRQIITIPSRRDNVSNFCKSLDINETIFSAILKNDIKYDNPHNLKLGEIACALSQEQVLKNFTSSMHNSLLIFEDDIMPINHKMYTDLETTQEHVKNYVKKAVEYLPTDWDVLYFGRCWDNCRRHTPVNKFLVKVHRTMCHHAIAFSRRGAQKILDNITHPFTKPIDHIVSGLCSNGTITCYATVVPVFYQNREELFTTIGNFDKLPICMN